MLVIERKECDGLLYSHKVVSRNRTRITPTILCSGFSEHNGTFFNTADPQQNEAFLKHLEHLLEQLFEKMFA